MIKKKQKRGARKSTPPTAADRKGDGETINLLLRDVPKQSLVPFGEGEADAVTRNARILRVLKFFSEKDNGSYLDEILRGSKTPVVGYAEQAELLWFGDLRFSQRLWHLSAGYYHEILLHGDQLFPGFERVALYRLGFVMFEIGIELEWEAIAEDDEIIRAHLFDAATRAITRGMEFNERAIRKYRDELGINCTFNQACGAALRARIVAEQSILKRPPGECADVLKGQAKQHNKPKGVVEPPQTLESRWRILGGPGDAAHGEPSPWRRGADPKDVAEVDSLLHQAIRALYEVMAMKSDRDANLHEWHAQAIRDTDLLLLRVDRGAKRLFDQWSRYCDDILYKSDHSGPKIKAFAAFECLNAVLDKQP